MDPDKSVCTSLPLVADDLPSPGVWLSTNFSWSEVLFQMLPRSFLGGVHEVACSVGPEKG